MLRYRYLYRLRKNSFCPQADQSEPLNQAENILKYRNLDFMKAGINAKAAKLTFLYINSFYLISVKMSNDTTSVFSMSCNSHWLPSRLLQLPGYETSFLKFNFQIKKEIRSFIIYVCTHNLRFSTSEIICDLTALIIQYYDILILLLFHMFYS